MWHMNKNNSGPYIYPDRIEELRSFGRAIKAKQDGCLPNVDATLRKLMKLKKDVIIEKYYASHGVCTAKLVKTEKVASSLYPGQQRDAWKVKYTADGLEEHFEEEELRSGKEGPVPAAGDGKPVLVVRNLPERAKICDQLTRDARCEIRDASCMMCRLKAVWCVQNFF